MKLFEPVIALSVCLILLSSDVFAQAGLFISEYVEGSANNKAIEIVNGTGSTINLSLYSVVIYINGSSTPTSTVALPSVDLPHGSTYVVVNPSADVLLQSYANFFSGGLTFNGNDAVALQDGPAILDVLGQIGYNPGLSWGTDPNTTLDHTLRRRSSVNTGDTTPGDAFDPAIEWDSYAVDAFDGLGNHSFTPLPIQLTFFKATSLSAKGVLLRWTTASEINNYGFEVERSPGPNWVFQLLPESFIPGHGTTAQENQYSFTDQSATAGKWSYRLKQTDLDGTQHYTEPIPVEVLTGVDAGVLPTEYLLAQNYPNPFNPVTVISFQLPVVSIVRLVVCDLLGREVEVLVDGRRDAGVHEVKFDGSNLASGVYLYRLEAESYVSTKKLLLLR